MQKSNIIEYCEKIPFKLWLVSCFIGANIINFTYSDSLGSFDITDEKKFSLSEPSFKIISSLDSPITLSFYRSDFLESEFPALRNYSEQVKDFLNIIAKNSNGKIKFSMHIVESYSEEEDEVVAMGLTGLPHKDGRSIFLGLIAENQRDNVGILPFLSPERENMLEFDLMSLIDGLGKKQSPKIAISSSLPLSVGNANMNEIIEGKSKSLAIFQDLQSKYDIDFLDEDYSELSKKDAPKVTLLLHPNDLTPKAEANLKSYIEKGGRVLATLDSINEMTVSSQSSVIKNPIMTSSLPSIFKEIGISHYSNQVILDKKLAKRGRDPQSGRPHDYLAWLEPKKENFNVKQPILSYIQKLSFGTAGYFELKDKKNPYNYTSLITSSPEADTISTQKLLSTNNMDDIENSYIARHDFDLAVQVSGQFKFKNSQIKNEDKKESVLIFISDSDFMDDRFWLAPTANHLTPTAFADNGLFLLNITDYLLQDTNLISLRGRNAQSHRLDYLDEIKDNAQNEFAEEEKRLHSEINKIMLNIKQLKSDKQIGLNSEKLSDEVSKATNNLLELRKKLREVKREMNRTLSTMEQKIKIFHIIIWPIIFGLIPMSILWMRRKKQYAYQHIIEKNISDE